MKTKSFTKVTLLSLFVMSVITAVTLNSCQKEKSVKPKTATNKGTTKLPNPFDLSTQIFNDANGRIFGLSGKTQKGIVSNIYGVDSSGCVTVTTDTVDKPHTITYSYANGCTESDGFSRSGSVVIAYDNSDIRVVNNVWTVTYNNYQTPGSLINGVTTLTNTGTNSNGNLVLVETAAWTYAQATETLSIGGTYNYEWIAGVNSSPLQNLQFNVTGAVTMTSSASPGDSAVSTITQTLVKNAKNPGCNFYIQGVLTNSYYIQGDTSIETDNYNIPGGCSGQVSVTQNGNTTIENQ